MRRFILAFAAAIGTAALWIAAPAPASAAGAANFSTAPHLGSLLGPNAQQVDFFMHKKYHHGCYRPYFCKTKYGHHGKHYKHCYYGQCYTQTYHYKPHQFYKQHHHRHKKHH